MYSHRNMDSLNIQFYSFITKRYDQLTVYTWHGHVNLQLVLSGITHNEDCVVWGGVQQANLQHSWTATDPSVIVIAFSAVNNRSCYIWKNKNKRKHNSLGDFKTSCHFSPRWVETPFGPRASLPVFWNCAFFLWGVRLPLRDPSSCSSTWWSCRRHPRRCPPQTQAGAWGTWLNSWSCCVLYFLLSFLEGRTVLRHVHPPRVEYWESERSGATTRSERAAPADLLSLWLTGCSTTLHCPKEATLNRFTQMPIETLMPSLCVCMCLCVFLDVPNIEHGAFALAFKLSNPL